MTTPEENIAIVGAYIDAHNELDLAAIDEILHDNFVENGHQAVAADPANNADELANHQLAHDLHPEHEIRIDDARAFDNQVWVVTTVIVSQHTHTGALVALAAPLEVIGLGRYAIECGQIATATTASDLVGLLLAVGYQLVPPAP